MSRSRNILTDAAIRAAVRGDFAAGKLKDGGGLYLMPNKRWVYFFKFRSGGKLKEKELWLGAWPEMDLKHARLARNAAEGTKESGVSPTDQRQVARALKRGLTFGEYAAENIDKLGPKKEPGRAIWLRQMTTPQFIGEFVHMLPNDIRLEHVERALAPYWETRTATSIILRMRIRRILSSARAKRLIVGERWMNPAIYRDNLEHTMPKVERIEEPRRSVPWQDLPGFMARLRSQNTRLRASALAAEWLVLTTMRVSACVGAQWGEIDLKARTWTVPAVRMKGREGKVKEHVVPLNLPMLRVLRAALPRGVHPMPSTFIFPSNRSYSGHVETSGVWNVVLDHTSEGCPHGFRATFETWAEEETDFGETIISMTTGHVKKDKVQRRYARSDLLGKRRRLMRAWGRWCDQPPPGAEARSIAA